MTLEVNQTPVAAVVSMVAADAGVSISIGSGVEGDVTARFDKVPVRKVVQDIASIVGAVVVIRDGAARIVKRDDSTLGNVRVIRVGKRDSKQVAEALSLMLGSAGRVTAVGDSIMISGPGDLDAFVDWIQTFLDDPVAGWLLELRVYQLTRSTLMDVGINLNLGAVASGQVGTNVSTVGAISASAEARLRSLSSSGRSRLVTEGTMWLLEGREGVLIQGDSIPVPQRSVTDQGTVTVTGYTNIQTGFEVRARVDRHNDRAVLSMQPKLSSIVRLVNDEVPVISTRSLDAVAVLNSGEWLYVAGLEVEDSRREGSGHFGINLGGSVSSDRSSVLIVVRATRVYDGS